MRIRVRMSVYEHEQSRAKQNRSGRRRDGCGAVLGTDYISGRSGGACNELHCPDQGLGAEAAGDEGADARSDALQVVRLEDDVQRIDKDACACFVQGDSHARGGLVCFALVRRLELWSSTLGFGMQGDKRTPGQTVV